MLTAKIVDRLLSLYGRFVPHHPGRWRITDKLSPLARPAWSGPRVAIRNGLRFEVDPSDFVGRAVLYDHEYESYETHYLRSAIRPGSCVVDAGAHIGWFTVLFSQLVGSSGVVHAFEPCADTRLRLERNLKLNSATNVCVHGMALGNNCEKVGIRYCGAHNTGKNQVNIGDGEIQMVSLDSLGLKRLDFIKADVEGCEGLLLRGGATTIQQLQPAMLVELNPAALADFGDTAEGIVDQLQTWGYRILQPTWRGLKPLLRVPQHPNYTNIVALPEIHGRT